MSEEEWLKKIAERIAIALEKIAEMAEVYTDPEKMLEWSKKLEEFQKKHPELARRPEVAESPELKEIRKRVKKRVPRGGIHMATTKTGKCEGCGSETKWWVSFLDQEGKAHWNWMCPKCIEARKPFAVYPATTKVITNPPTEIKHPTVVDSAFFKSGLSVVLIEDDEGNLYLSPFGASEIKTVMQRTKQPIPEEDVAKMMQEGAPYNAGDLIKGIIFIDKNLEDLKNKVIATSLTTKKGYIT